MKIAVIGHKTIPYDSGGIECHVEALYTTLVESGCNVTVYNRSSFVKDKQVKNYRGIRCKTVFSPPIKGISAAVCSFLASLRAAFSKSDVVHYHALGPAAMCWIARLFRKKVVVTVHGLDWQRAKWGGFAKTFLLFGEKMAVRFAHQIIVVNPVLIEYYQKEYGRACVAIKNGIYDFKVETSASLAKYDITPQAYILFLARIVPEKGCHYLLEAFSRIKSSPYKLVIAGASGEADAYYQRIRGQYSHYDNILFTGEVVGLDRDELYSNAGFFVLPSDVEGLSIGLLEAMSCGLCPLVSDIAENMSVIKRDGLYGFSFQAGSVEDLQQKLQYMMAHPEHVKEIGRRARDYVLREFQWDKIAEQTERVYQKVCSK